jgi:hypothetical protein
MVAGRCGGGRVVEGEVGATSTLSNTADNEGLSSTITEAGGWVSPPRSRGGLMGNDSTGRTIVAASSSPG